LCFWFINIAGYPALTTKVGALIAGFGAKEAGLEVGDKITAVDERKVDYWDDLQSIIQAKKPGTIVKLFFLRNNREYSLDVNIKEKKIDDGLGSRRSIGLLGISPYDEVVIVKHAPFKSFSLGLKKTWALTTMTYQALGQMLRLKLSIKEATGPLGIFFITSHVARQGIIAILNLMGIISVSLSLFNLLPFPVLDGGHILLLAIEKIRGKYLSLKAERIITQVGLSFIIFLALIVTYNDIMRLFGDKLSRMF